MMATNGVGVYADISRQRLPSDAYPALFAYSLNRKLRYLYNGPYFRYRQETGGELEYPQTTPDFSENVYLVKVYDQKIRFGFPVKDAVQLDQSKQPLIESRTSSTQSPSRPTEVGSSDVGRKIQALATIPARGLEEGKVYEIESVNTASKQHMFLSGSGVVNIVHIGVQWVFLDQVAHYVAVFNENEYLDVQNLAPYIGQNFTITVTGEGDDIPRPLIGIWGETDTVTYEPSTLTNRFSFNSNLGSINSSTEDTSQCFSGFDKTQNYTNVMSVKIGNETSFRAMPETSPQFENISIGRERQRFYKGSFKEVTMHLGNLTKLGAEQIYTTTRGHYGY